MSYETNRTCCPFFAQVVWADVFRLMTEMRRGETVLCKVYTEWYHMQIPRKGSVFCIHCGTVGTIGIFARALPDVISGRGRPDWPASSRSIFCWYNPQCLLWLFLAHLIL